MSDSIFYQNNCQDTSNVNVWNLLYEEMFYSAHDTTWMTPVSDVIEYPTQFYGDTIVIGLMDYDFFHCVPNSISTGNYFFFDTIANQILDHPSPISSPYGRSNIFAASALKQNSYFLNPVFRIDPGMFFTDNVNQPLYTNQQSVRIDFGDGTGWHYYDMGILNHYEADYPNDGQKIIRVEVYDWAMDRTLKESTSEIMVLKNNKSETPDEVFELHGLQIGYYKPCGVSENERAVIYLEGIDMLDMVPALSRGIDVIYDDMINSRYIEELRNFNYAFYVVNWKNSRIDMRFNALNVLNLIEFLKDKYADSEEQFVIIGESMGGVIARYVLTFMESDAYLNSDFSAFFVESSDPQNAVYLTLNPSFEELGSLNRIEELREQLHKTRSLITIDSPHQGANIPLSMQYAYKSIFKHLPYVDLVSYFTNIGLESKATKQLLLYHVNSNPLSNLNNTTYSYNADNSHYSFFGQLRELGEYPNHCKLIALSNAALDGSRQVTDYNQTLLRSPNDEILDLDLDLYARVLWIPVPVFSAQVLLRSNPDGNGQLFAAAIGNFTLDLNVYLFGINIDFVFGNIYTSNKYATNVKPYCVSSAGYFYTGVPIGQGYYVQGSSYNLHNWWIFNLYSHDVNSSNGCVTLNSHIGLNGLASANLDFSLCSKGTNFGFIPLQSALDYGRDLNLPLNHDIQNENLSTALSRTPFDVIIGYTEGKNIDHLSYRDELIYNITQASATNCNGIVTNGQFAYYNADLENECEVKRSILCLEIGDEELYLENWELNRNATFQAQFDILVNERNPYYEYVSQSPTAPINLGGYYSKESPFLVNSDGYAKFLVNANSANNPGIQFVYNEPQSENWHREHAEMDVCTNDYAQGKNQVIQEELNLGENHYHLSLYPNPNSGEVMMLNYNLPEDENVQLVIYDLRGKQVFQMLKLEGGEHSVRLHLDHLTNGVYLVKISTKSTQRVARLIIQ